MRAEREAEGRGYGLVPLQRHDDPELPEDVKANQLDKGARGELKTLSKDNADGVARHLVMAARLIEENPALAHRHSLAAARRAGRVAIVHETVAITAYAVGDFALALRELRTYRRISGSNDQLPLMVDSERGVGRPERALELGRSVPRSELDVPVQVGLAIAMSGARLDLGQAELALQELRIPQLDPDRAFSWSPALFAAYAAVQEELGDAAEAERWYELADRAEEALEDAAIEDDTIEIVEEELPEGDAETGDEVAASDDLAGDEDAAEAPADPIDGTDGDLAGDEDAADEPGVDETAELPTLFDLADEPATDATDTDTDDVDRPDASR